MTGKLGGAATTSALLSMMCAALLALASSEALAAPDESTELLGHSQWNSFIEQRLAVGRAALAPRGPKRVQLERLRSQKAPSSVSVLVVGVDFSDSLLVGRDNTMPEFAGWPTQNRTASTIPFTSLPMFAAHDSVYFDIQMRKTADYFETVSFGRLNIDWDVHGEILNASLLKNATNQAGAANSSMGYYGDEDSSAVRLVALSQLVIDTLDAEVDFGNYDTLMLIHAGAGQETDILGDSPEQIFSNYLDSRDFEEAQEAGLLDGSVLMTEEGPLEHVLILPESESQDPFPEAGFLGFFGTRGVYCFEFALRLGMINMGDFTPAGRPDSQGIGNYGLMGFGLFTGLGIVPSAPCAFNRWLMGWVDREDIEADCPLGRIGQAEEMAGIAVYLASRASNYTNGAVIPVDGGTNISKGVKPWTQS